MSSHLSPWALLAAVVVPALLFPAQGCNPSIPDDWEVTGNAQCRHPDNATEEYYEATMRPFFDEYCSYCHWSDVDDRHGAPAGKDFDTFEAAKLAPRLTWARVSSFDMPPMGRLPHTGELDTLLDWLNCVSVAPDLPEEIGDCPEGSTVTSEDVEVVLDANCIRCHSENLEGEARNKAPAGINWDTAERLSAFQNDEYIWGRISSGEMPADGPMTNPEALVIREWFSCGSP
jgi:mono/diheme cytochrome c family protein